jgi:hypothetical protein
LDEHYGFLVVVIRPAKPLGVGFAGLLLCAFSGQGKLLGGEGAWV